MKGLSFTQITDIEANTNFILPKSGANFRMLKKAAQYRNNQRDAKSMEPNEPPKKMRHPSDLQSYKNFLFSDTRPVTSYDNKQQVLKT